MLGAPSEGFAIRRKVQSTANAHFVHVLVSVVTITKKYEQLSSYFSVMVQHFFVIMDYMISFMYFCGVDTVYALC